MNGLAEFYREENAKEIKRLEDELATKDEKNKADNVARIKRLMKKHYEDFDTVFSDFDLDHSLKEEYRKLVEEKTLFR